MSAERARLTLQLAPEARRRIAARLGLAAPPPAALPPAALPPIAPQPRASPDRSTQLLSVLRTRAPAVFCDPPKPLAIGIRATMIELLADDFSPKDIRRVLSAWCGGSDYRRVLVAGAARYALDGTVTGEVTADQAALVEVSL